MQRAGRASQVYDRPSLRPHSTNQSDGGGIYTVIGEEARQLPTQNRASLQHAAHTPGGTHHSKPGSPLWD